MTYRTSGRRPPKFSASELNRLNEAADRQFIRSKLVENSIPAVSESSVVLAKNSSGTDRERYDCMSISGLLWDFEPDGTTDLIFDLDTADPDAAPAILLEPIADGAFGLVMIDGPAIAKVEISTDAAFRYAVPKASTHSLEPAASGPIKLLAAPSESAVKYIPCIIEGQPGTAPKFFTLMEDVTSPDGAFYARPTNRLDDAPGDPQLVYNWDGILNGAVAGYHGLYLFVNGEWVIDGGACVPDPCAHTGVLTVGSPPDGTVDVEYAGHTLTTITDVTSLSADGLPDGLTMNGSGEISGTPTEAGTFYVVVTGVSGDDDCDVTRVMVLTVNEAE